MKKSGTIGKLLKNSTPNEIFALWLLVIPPVIAAWVSILQGLGFKDDLLSQMIGVLLVIYVFSFRIAYKLVKDVAQHRELKTKVVSYLTQNGFKMASFNRLEEKIPATADELRDLLEIYPESFRSATIKGGKPGLALLNHVIEKSDE